MEQIIAYFQTNTVDFFTTIFVNIFNALITWNYNVRANQFNKKEKKAYLMAILIAYSITIIEIFLGIESSAKIMTIFVVPPLLLYLFIRRNLFFTVMELLYFFVIDFTTNVLVTAGLFIAGFTALDFQQNPAINISLTSIYIIINFIFIRWLHRPIGSKLYQLRNRIWNKEGHLKMFFFFYIGFMFMWILLIFSFIKYCMSIFDSRFLHVTFLLGGFLSILLLIIMFTILYQQNQFDQLQQEAVYDDLTKTMNRKFGLKYIDSVLKKKKETLVLCYVDLNSLKKINDELGHQYGDELICFQVQQIRESIGEKPVMVRMGGDEFVVTFPSESLDRVIAKMEDALRKISEKKEAHYETYDISFSYGCIAYHPEGEAVDSMELISKADHLMYEHKKRYKEKNALTE